MAAYLLVTCMDSQCCQSFIVSSTGITVTTISSHDAVHDAPQSNGIQFSLCNNASDSCFIIPSQRCLVCALSSVHVNHPVYKPARWLSAMQELNTTTSIEAALKDIYMLVLQTVLKSQVHVIKIKYHDK